LSSSADHSPRPSGFDRFGLHPSLLRGTDAAGFDTPRPVQDAAIPAGLDGRDVLGLAQTGTGKTAAFALPLLQRILDTQRRGPQALVLAPTRELANQIDAEIRELAKFTKVQTATIFGGVSQYNQVRALRGRPEIIVGCPGRVLDLLQQRELNLSDVEMLVLDEADHMFDMGFLPDVRRIMAALPTKRQNLLFSATMPREIRQLADELQRDPHVVELANSAPAETIDHALYAVKEDLKRDLLDVVLGEDDCESAIVFTRTKHRAKRLAEQLSRKGLRAVALQGNMSQGQRDRAMRGFRDGSFDILVATDIAARGIDVSDISHVINFDVPNTPEAYTHRIGRTGRSEREGTALTFVTREDSGWLRATERMIGEPITRCVAEGFGVEPVDGPDQKSSRSNGRQGRDGNGGGNRNRIRSGSRDDGASRRPGGSGRSGRSRSARSRTR
jgi:ATP-dependent RNA helicase RhlE